MSNGAWLIVLGLWPPKDLEKKPQVPSGEELQAIFTIGKQKVDKISGY